MANTDAAVVYNDAAKPEYWGRIMEGQTDVTDRFWEARDTAEKTLRRNARNGAEPTTNGHARLTARP